MQRRKWGKPLKSLSSGRLQHLEDRGAIVSQIIVRAERQQNTDTQGGKKLMAVPDPSGRLDDD